MSVEWECTWRRMMECEEERKDVSDRQAAYSVGHIVVVGVLAKPNTVTVEKWKAMTPKEGREASS